MPTIDDYRWLTSAEGIRHWRNLADACSESMPVSTLRALRQTLSESFVAMLVEQVRLSKLATRKFNCAAGWFWTQQLLEQSSDEHTAAESAEDFPVGCNVIDFCCGAGADAIALGRVGNFATAIDRCDIACELTRHNSRTSGVRLEVRNLDIQDTLPVLDENTFIHIDPDRRADGSRSTSLSRLSPSWETISGLIRLGRGMSLKLAPGTHSDEESAMAPTDLPEAKRWLSRDGSVRQQRWYWGIDRWPRGSVNVSMQSKSLAWHHESFRSSDLTLDASESCISGSVRRFVADYDPVIRAARVSTLFANRYHAQLLETRNGYLSADLAVPHPMIRWFEVNEVLPLDRKRLRRFARDAKIRTWELKSRSLEINLDEWRRILPIDRDSETNATILFTKINGRHRAIVATVQ